MDVCVADLTPFGVPGGAKLLRCEVMVGPCLLYFGRIVVTLVGFIQLSSGVITIFGVPGVAIVPWGCGVMLGPIWLVKLRQVQMLLCFIVVSVV